jgi:hypothetical protein
VIVKTNTPAPRRPGLMQIACDCVVRSDVAMRAVQMWKANPAVRRAHGSVANLYDVLAEQEERRAAHLSGEKKEAK